MTRCRRDWSEAENTTLTHLYIVLNLSAQHCADQIGRTRYSVQAQVDKLGLRKDSLAAGKLRRIRKASHGVNAMDKVRELQSMAPEKPTVRPAVAMAGVWFEDVALKRGTPVCGDRLARRMAHVA